MAFDRYRFLHPGNFAYMDGEGFIFFVGRLVDRIIGRALLSSRPAGYFIYR